MWPRKIQIIAVFMVLVMSAALVGSLGAQDASVESPTPTSTPSPTPTNTPTQTPSPTPTNTPTQTPSPTMTLTPTNTPTEEVVQVQALQAQVAEIVVRNMLPTEFVQGTGGTLTIAGANFTNSTTVSLNGSLNLSVETQTDDTLLVTIGADLMADSYAVTVSDPTGGTKSAPGTLNIVAPDTVAQLTVTHNEPMQIMSGESTNLSVLGANFTESTTVRLLGYGFLVTNFINSGALTAELPPGLPVGQYAVEVSDPTNGTVQAPNPLTVTAAPTEATETPEPTEIPGEATLTVRGFSASPSGIYPGGSTLLTFEVVNAGNRTAEGIVVSLGSGSFAPASGQASLTLPDLGSYESYTVSMSVVASVEAPEGIASIPVVMTSRDFSGQTYTDEASLSVTILEEEAGESQVVLDSYSATPNAAQSGETVSIQARFINLGSATASQVLVQLDTNNGVLIAGAQGSSFAIGDLQPGASTVITMPLVVASDAPSGVQSQAFTISYVQDEETRQNDASISFEVVEQIEASQVTLDSYHVSPMTALPGDPVSVQAVFVNTGNVTASQVLVQLDATSGILIAGSEGSSFAIGDIQPGASATLTMPLIVASDAPSGVQSQALAISFLQSEASQQTSASISLSIEQAIEASPMLLLQSYSTGQEEALQPGQQFTFEMSLQNAGSVDASGLLVTFGQTRSTSSDGTTSTTSSSSFAPLGSGDTRLVGELLAGETITIGQEFIVSNDLSSGVYQLPITVQYQDAEGTTSDESINASLVVIMQPRLRVTLNDDLDDLLTLGETYTLSIDIANLGASDVALTAMRVGGENVTVTEGAETLLESLQSDDDITESAAFEPLVEGTYSVTIEVDYLDDLNQTQTVVTTFSGEVTEPERRAAAPERFAPPTPEEEEEENLVGRLLLGFLGLGG